MSKLIKKIIRSVNKKNTHFVYVSINHGFWDRVFYLNKLGLSLNNLKQSDLNNLFKKSIKEDVYYNFIRLKGWQSWKAKEIIRIGKYLKKKFPKDFYIVNGIYSNLNSELLYGTPMYGEDNLNTLIKENTNKNNYKIIQSLNGSGYEFKQMLLTGDINLFFEKFKKEKIIMVGPKTINTFDKIWNLNINYIYIHPTKGVLEINLVRQKIKKEISNGTKIFFICFSVYSLVLASDLENDIIKNNVKFYDLGLVPELVCNFDIHRDKFVLFYKKTIFKKSLSKLPYFKKKKINFIKQNYLKDNILDLYSNNKFKKIKKKNIINYINKNFNFLNNDVFEYFNFTDKKIFISSNIKSFFLKLNLIQNNNHGKLLCSNISSLVNEFANLNHHIIDAPSSNISNLNLHNESVIDSIKFICFDNDALSNRNLNKNLYKIRNFAKINKKILILNSTNNINYLNNYSNYCDIEIVKFDTNSIHAQNDFFLIIINKSLDGYDYFNNFYSDLNLKELNNNLLLNRFFVNCKDIIFGQFKRIIKLAFLSGILDHVPCNPIGTKFYLFIKPDKTKHINFKNKVINIEQIKTYNENPIQFPITSSIQKNLVEFEFNFQMSQYNEKELYQILFKKN